MDYRFFLNKERNRRMTEENLFLTDNNHLLKYSDKNGSKQFRRYPVINISTARLTSLIFKSMS